MLPYDALFLALLAGCCAEATPRRSWLAAVPLLVQALAAAPLPPAWAAPLAALLAARIVPAAAPAALLLAIPRYAGWPDALACALGWLVLGLVHDGLSERIQLSSVPSRLAGWPIRLLTLGSLYFAALPLAWLR